MYIPSITNIETALTIYYKHAELGNKEIKELFGCRSSATTSRLKRLARAEMIKRGIPTFNAYKVNTATAYKVWGIDIDSLEQRMRKIKELSL
jgi:DNA-binding Lrp family transcriptional regulator